jgi:FkbM family methyltransferase
MKIMIFFILLIQSLKLISLPSEEEFNSLKEKIKKYTNGSDISIYPHCPEMESVGYGSGHFFKDGEHLVVRSFIKKNDVIVDAGANIGLWAEMAASVVDFECKIYAFEPVGSTFDKLKKNITAKRMDATVSYFNCALGRKDGRREMNCFEGLPGCNSMFNRPVFKERLVEKITVPVTSIDEFVHKQSIAHINFLKIDTEGSELDIIMGAKNLIESGEIDVIQFEYGGCYRDAGTTLSEVYAYLRSNGYMIFRIIPSGLLHIPEWNQKLEIFHLSNYLAVKDVLENVSQE